MTNTQDKTRTTFEEWVIEEMGWDLNPNSPEGAYYESDAKIAWKAWQAHAAETEALIEELVEALRTIAAPDMVVEEWVGIERLPIWKGIKPYWEIADQALQRVEAYRGKE